MDTESISKQEAKLLLIDKPAGITSFDVIRILRRKTGIRKMGHSGTLDPFATGLLLIGVNEGTKELTKLIKLDKVYEATILLGVQTDTGDYTGKKLVDQDTSHIKDEDIEKSLQDLVGTHQFQVPKYSAIKVSGKKLYELARAGAEFEAPVKEMTVYSADLESIEIVKNKKIVKARFHVASGTYIRTLGEEFGNMLGVPAVLTELRRTKVGEYDVSDAEKIEI
jgi:tRNA pseudouridine55 synthase